MPRLRLKAFDPHNPDVKARLHWERLQRGEHLHAYDQPPTKAQQRRDDQQRPSLALRRFQAQVAAAKAQKTGTAEKREPAKPDTQLTDGKKRKKGAKRDKGDAGKGGDDEAEHRQKRQREAEGEAELSREEQLEEEERTRRLWEDKANRMTGKGKPTTPSPTSSATPSSPPPRDFLPAEVIPYGTQVERPPQRLPALKLRHPVKPATSSLTLKDYADERQRAQEAYHALRLKRRSTTTSTVVTTS